MTPPPLDGPHWRFALELYAAPGVAPACLELQDRNGIDVVLMLVALYAARAGLRAGPDELRGAQAATAAFRTDVILPLRAVRRRLKLLDLGVADEAHNALRTTVKRAELAAERLQMAAQVAALAGHPDASQRSPRAVIEDVLAVCDGTVDARTADVIAVIAGASERISAAGSAAAADPPAAS